MRRTILLTLLIAVCTFTVALKAQEESQKWTLRSCLDYAIENNIQLKKNRVNELSGLEDTE